MTRLFPSVGRHRRIRPFAMRKDHPMWQPIETAPKDGTDILVGYDFAAVWIVHVAFWSEGTCTAADGSVVELWRDQGFDSEDEATGWWSYTWGSVSQDKLEGSHAPTHWMALPEPPTSVNTEQ